MFGQLGVHLLFRLVLNLLSHAVFCVIVHVHRPAAVVRACRCVVSMHNVLIISSLRNYVSGFVLSYDSSPLAVHVQMMFTCGCSWVTCFL